MGDNYYICLVLDDKTVKVPRIMFDDGTFKHMWGTDLVKAGLVTNIREVNPHLVHTAGGGIKLNQMGVVFIGDNELLAGYLNPHMGLSLCSEGKQHTHEGWRFIGEQGTM